MWAAGVPLVVPPGFCYGSNSNHGSNSHAHRNIIACTVALARLGPGLPQGSYSTVNRVIYLHLLHFSPYA